VINSLPVSVVRLLESVKCEGHQTPLSNVPFFGDPALELRPEDRIPRTPFFMLCRKNLQEGGGTVSWYSPQPCQSVMPFSNEHPAVRRCIITRMN